MKMNKFVRGAAVFGSVAGLILAEALSFPAMADTRRTVVVTYPTPLTGLNSSATGMNLVTNSEVTYPTGFGFYWANNEKKVVPNTKFGTYKIIKKAAGDFRVKYTINPGQKWNDGTPIDGVDLLLSNVLSNSKYSIAAGLGDPASSTSDPAFDSLGYGGNYDKNIVDVLLSDDKMSVTLVYKDPIADWDLNAPGPSPVHTLELMADGKTSLGSASENLAAKAKFLDDYTKKNTARLTAMGKIWTTGYNIKTVNEKTNPLLLVGNGGFKIQSCVDQISCTLVVDPVTNGVSGPKVTGIDKIVYRFDVADTSAPQALGNKEVDLYSGQLTADGLTQLKAVKGINILSGPQATYEQLSMRTDGPNGVGTYAGPFAGETMKARALRRAFLLAIPREDMIEKIIKPTDPNAVVLNSRTVMPSDGAAYTSFINSNGFVQYFGAPYATRMAEAAKIMDRYVPNWKNEPVVVNFLHRNNARRTAQCNLYAASLIKVGFKITCGGRADWSSQTRNVSYDVGLFAWGAGLPQQTGDCAQVKSASPNSTWGWKNGRIDGYCAYLEGGPLLESSKLRSWANIEKEVALNAYSLPLFQWPGIVAVNSDLKGVKPSPITPNLVWNYWEWTY